MYAFIPTHCFHSSLHQVHCVGGYLLHTHLAGVDHVCEKIRVHLRVYLGSLLYVFDSLIDFSTGVMQARTEQAHHLLPFLSPPEFVQRHAEEYPTGNIVKLLDIVHKFLAVWWHLFLEATHSLAQHKQGDSYAQK